MRKNLRSNDDFAEAMAILYAFNGIVYAPSGILNFSGDFSCERSLLEGRLAYDNSPDNERDTISGVLLSETQFCAPHRGRSARNYLIFAHYGKLTHNNWFTLFKEESGGFSGKYSGKFNPLPGRKSGCIREYLFDTSNAHIALDNTGFWDVELDLSSKTG